MNHYGYCQICKHQDDFKSDVCVYCIWDGEKAPNNFEAAAKKIPLRNINFEDKPKDAVNHPNHYTQGNIEVIDYIIDKLTGEQFEGYVIGNVLKYVSRYRHKGGFEDLKKANWYLSKLIETGEGK